MSPPRPPCRRPRRRSAATRRRVGGSSTVRWRSSSSRWPSRSRPDLIRDLASPRTRTAACRLSTMVLMSPIFMLLALGLNIVVGYAGLLDLGYVAFWAIGAYIARLVHVGRSSSSVDFHFLSAAPETAARASTSTSGSCCIIGGMRAPVAGIVIGAPTLRLRGDYLAIVTLGFGEIIPQVFLNLDESAAQLTNGTRASRRSTRSGSASCTPSPVGASPRSSTSSTSSRATTSSSSSASVRSTCRCGCATASWAGPGSPSARTSWRPSAMGIPLMRTKLWAYAVGAFFGGVGGVFYAVDQSAVFPTASSSTSRSSSCAWSSWAAWGTCGASCSGRASSPG